MPAISSCIRVVICFHFLIFSLKKKRFLYSAGVESADYIYICATKNNSSSELSSELLVVICFHFLIFVPQRTTAFCVQIFWTMLWFAFIFLSLCHKEQPRSTDYFSASGCDLLSFSYLCATKNNLETLISALVVVVICFHFLIFVPQRTTHTLMKVFIKQLWFAFIFLSLCHKEQQARIECLKTACCDLLSFSYLCATKNNELHLYQTLPLVVICFHFLIFVPQRTTWNWNFNL